MKTPPLDQFIIGDAPAIQKLRALIAKAARRSLPVLIQGESGVGKELVAQALHGLSGRTGEIVSFNVCAIAETMFESELFGHAKGAFTGATADTPGFLRQADRGTVFLDEISGLQMSLQVKLLRAIETGTFRPVGGREDRHSDFRLVAATNQELASLVRTNRFRADLMHRLRGCVLTVPPLRDRLQDIPALARHFLRLTAVEDGDPTEFTPEALRILQCHDWEGNVRELKHVVAHAVMLGTGRLIDVGAIVGALEREGLPAESAEPSRPVAGAGVDCAMRRHLLSILERVGGDTAEAALVCGRSRASIYRDMKRLAIPLPSRGARTREAAEEH